MEKGRSVKAQWGEKDENDKVRGVEKVWSWTDVNDNTEHILSEGGPSSRLSPWCLTLIPDLSVVWARLWSVIKKPAVAKGEKWGKKGVVRLRWRGGTLGGCWWGRIKGAEGRLNNVLCFVNLSCWLLNYTSAFINDWIRVIMWCLVIVCRFVCVCECVFCLCTCECDRKKKISQGSNNPPSSFTTLLLSPPTPSFFQLRRSRLMCVWCLYS